MYICFAAAALSTLPPPSRCTAQSFLLLLLLLAHAPDLLVSLGSCGAWRMDRPKSVALSGESDAEDRNRKLNRRAGVLHENEKRTLIEH